eukprot:SAG11_NODE_10950_length_794_cov_0.579856_1_plen_22_part_10
MNGIMVGVLISCMVWHETHQPT